MHLVKGSDLPPKQVVIFNGFPINTTAEYGPSEMEIALPVLSCAVELNRLHEWV
jgi:hypothetical protein